MKNFRRGERDSEDDRGGLIASGEKLSRVRSTLFRE